MGSRQRPFVLQLANHNARREIDVPREFNNGGSTEGAMTAERRKCLFGDKRLLGESVCLLFLLLVHAMATFDEQPFLAVPEEWTSMAPAG